MSRGLNDFYSDYVYRVLRPDEDPNNDLTCVNSCSTCTIDKHVESGLHTPTRFISTTTSMDKARKWINTADNITYRKYKNKRSVIVKIDIELIKRKYPNVANSAYDLTDSNNRDYFLKNIRQKKFACAYSEIVFERYIPSEAVSVFYTTKDGYVNSENKKANVTREFSSDAILSRTTQSVLLPNDSNDQLRRTAEYNLKKSVNLERSLEYNSRKAQIDLLVEPEKDYLPSKRTINLGYQGNNVSFSSMIRRNRDINSTTFEGKKANYEESYQPYELEVLSQEGGQRDKIGVSSTDFEIANFSRPSIPARTLRPSLRKDLSEPRDYSNYERGYQPRQFEVSGLPDRAHYSSEIIRFRTRQSSTDFGTTDYSRPSLRTNMSPPEITPDAPRNKPLWKRVLSFLSCPFSQVNNQR